MNPQNEDIRILRAFHRDTQEQIKEMRKDINDLKLKVGAVFEKHFDKKKD